MRTRRRMRAAGGRCSRFGLAGAGSSFGWLLRPTGMSRLGVPTISTSWPCSMRLTWPSASNSMVWVMLSMLMSSWSAWISSIALGALTP